MLRCLAFLVAVVMAQSAVGAAANEPIESWIRPSDEGGGFELADCLRSALQGVRSPGERVYVEVLDVTNDTDSIGEQKLPRRLRSYMERVVTRVNTGFTLHDTQGMRNISPRSMDAGMPFNIGDRYGPSIQQGIAGQEKNAMRLIGQVVFANSEMQGANSSTFLDFGGDGKTHITELRVSIKGVDAKSAEVIALSDVTLVATRESTTRGVFLVVAGQNLIKHQQLRFRAASADEALRFLVSIATAQVLRMAAARYLTLPVGHCQGIVNDELWLGSRYPTDGDPVVRRRGILSRVTPLKTRLCFIFFDDARPKASSYHLKFSFMNNGDASPIETWSDYRTVIPTTLNDRAYCPTLVDKMRTYDVVEVELRDAKTGKLLDSTRELLAKRIAPELVPADLQKEAEFEELGLSSRK